nr:hypothetical protein [Acidobacteriota bacterium]
NWQEMASENSVMFAPQGGHGAINGQSVFTHGVQVGIARNETHSLEEATQELLASFAQANPQLGRSGNPTKGTLGGRAGLRTMLANVSEATGGRERIVLYTTQMKDGSLFYLIGVSPEGEFGTYQPVINRVAQSIRFLR